MAKKQKIKNEGPSINFRLPEELKQQIYKKASLHNKTISYYLRDHLQEFIDGSLYARGISYYEDNSFINSTEFLQLIIWMMVKRENAKCLASNEQLDAAFKVLTQQALQVI